MNAAELWQKIKPFAVRDLKVGTTGGENTGTSVATHALNGPAHTGSLARTQAPWVATDINTALNLHTADADAHHAKQHSITDGAVHTVVGSQWGVVGLSATNTLGILSSSSSPGATEQLVRTATDGSINLRALISSLNGVTGGAIVQGIVKTDTSFARAWFGHNAQWDTSTNLWTIDAIGANDAGGFLLPNNSSSIDIIFHPTTGYTTRTMDHATFIAGKKFSFANTGAFTGSTSFTSGFTGAGYRLDDGVATTGKTTLELDEMIVRGRMRVYELLIHQIRATNGSIFVTGVGKAKTVTGSGPYTIVTDTDHGFATNDLIRAQRFTGSGVYQCNMQVSSVASSTQFTATLSSGDAPAAGMEFVRLGNTTDTTRQGSIYLTADDTFAPAIDILDGVTSFAQWGSASKIKVRLGKLDSSLDSNLLPSGYGLYAPNAFLSGDLLTGGGNIRIYNASGINLKEDVWGSWDAKRALQWWPDVASMSGNPSLSLYTGKAVGGFTDQQNFSYIDAFPTGGKLAGLSLAAKGQGTGTAAGLYLEGGSQALGTTASATVTATTIDLVGTLLLDGTTAARQMNPQSDLGYSLGTALLRWNTLYVNQIVAGTISGTTMNGQEWEYAGSMVIDANSASNTTVSVVNQGTGLASLDVENNITLGGTVDGVDVAAFKSSYDSHVANANAHHAQSHVLATTAGLGADHTVSGLTTGQVLRATGATTAQFMALTAGDITTALGYTPMNRGGDTMTGNLTVNAQVFVSSPNFPPIRVERTTTATNSIQSGLQFVATTSSDMVDGFGAQILLGIQDNAGVINNIGGIRVQRDGSDSTGATSLLAGNGTICLYIAAGGNVGIGNVAPGYKLDVTGAIRATTSVLAPTITTASGNLTITSVGGTVAITGALTGSSTAAFATSVSAPLITTASGNLTLSAASGTVSVTGSMSGTNWTILSSGDATLAGVYTPLVQANGSDLTVTSVSNNLNLNGSSNVDVRIGGVSQWTMTSARLLPRSTLTMDIGDSNRRIRTLHAGELNVEILVAQSVMATIGGRIIVSPTNKLIADITLAATTIDVAYNNLVNGEYVYLSAAPGGAAQIEAMQVTGSATAITGGYRYSVSRNLDGSGANIWYAGDAVVSLRSAVGQGYIDLTSTNTIHNHYGPTQTFYVRTATTSWNSVSPVVTMGNLRSFVDYTGDEFGFATGNDLTLTPSTGFRGVTVDRTAGVRLFNTDIKLYNAGMQTLNINSTGTDIWVGTSSSNKRLHWNGATLNFNNSSGTAVITFDNSGASYFAGPMTIGSSGGIYQGSGTFASPTTGLKIWNDSGVGRIGGYNAGTLQCSIDTDGKFKSGDNRIEISASGGVRARITNNAYDGLLFINNDIVNYPPFYLAGLNAYSNNTLGEARSSWYASHINNQSYPVQIELRAANNANASIIIFKNALVGINQDTASYALDVNGSCHASSFPTSSDRRFKEALTPLSPVLDRLGRIGTYNFYWRRTYAGYDQFLDKQGRPQVQVGFVAQEVEQEFPELISRWRHVGSDGVETSDAYSVDYARMVPILVQAIRELRAELTALKSM